MPKIKTNRTAYKKYRANAKGKVKRGRANRSHNTAKRAPKRMRQLRSSTLVSVSDMPNVMRMLPYLGK